MRKTNTIILPILLFMLFSFQVTAEESNLESELKAEATDIVKAFAGSLKPKLKAALQAGGFEKAIQVCSVEAPKIAKSLSNEMDWNIRRVSLKPRNKSNATPDAFERAILGQFDRAQKAGKGPSVIEHSEIVGNKYRYMKAQVVESICLGCHGSSITSGVNEALQKYYPGDTATGYSLGQVRGAFSLIKDL